MQGQRVPVLGSSPRLIPAHAGKTGAYSRASMMSEAHPRACGENKGVKLNLGPQQGSSPRMRGKPPRTRHAARGRRLIPAHAGKTQDISPGRLLQRAHPRACGENHAYRFRVLQKRGSSPRMRGKRQSLEKRPSAPRLIPAHAGKTLQGCENLRMRSAHPRACGENPERSGVLALRSVRSWKTLSFPSSLKVTHCRAFVQLPFSRIRL